MKASEVIKTALDVAKLISAIAIVFGAVIGGARLYAYLSTRASAGEVNVLKAQRADDHELLIYVVKRIDGIGDQLNHQALTGRIPYVAPPPAPPEVMGPAPAPSKADAPR